MPPRKGKPLDLASAFDTFGQKLIDSASTPNINRYKPMPHQDLFHKAQTRHRAVTGGNQSGKTYSTTADDVLTAIRRHPHRQHLFADRPLRGRVITVDFDRGIEQVVLPYWQQMLPPSALINGSWTDSYSPSQHLLTLADGGQVSFMSYEQDPDKFQGVWLDWVHFDEEPPKPIWAESMVRLLRTGGCWTLSMTPVQQMEWVQDDVLDPAREGLLPDVSVWDLDTRKNIHLSQTQIAELEATLTEDEKKVRFEGQHLNHSLVFGEFTRKYPNVIPQQPLARFRPSWRWQVFEHMDHGYANPSSWQWTAVHEDGSIVTLAVLYQDHVIVQEWARRVHAVRDLFREAFDDDSWTPVATFGDPSIGQQNNGITGLTVQQEYARHGVGIATDGIVKARASNQMFGLNRMHTYLALRPIEAGPAASNGELGMPWWQIMENADSMDGFEVNNQALITELRKARKPKQTLKQQEVKNTSEEIRDKDNHAIDAAKYLFMSVPDLRPVRFQTVEGEIPDYAYQTLRPAATAIASHDQAYATISSDRRGSRSDDYDALEGA
ncbi:MAG: hypothetical protein K0R99_4306 [Microbacterium sp.]|jgi:phage terminase large subunit-like protein|uniref:terminase large subunit domain-containing protein n=1 Tax=Microbacterium sp. TaxID=51671 RepID=UPI00261E80E9|nr:terminase family protein [Microbacterium sp.]MDF2562860.1 hypothetical protein [Microbacterium sp.]